MIEDLELVQGPVMARVLRTQEPKLGLAREPMQEQS